MRTDNRENNDIRPLKIIQNLLTRCDGSIQLEQGNTVVLVSVTGPVEAPRRVEEPTRLVLDVLFKPCSGLPSCREKKFEIFVKQTLESFIDLTSLPRTLITVVIQEIKNDGALLACCINAATLALMEAGISLLNRCASITMAISQDEFVLDPVLKEEEGADSLHTIVFSKYSEQEYSIISLDSTGIFNLDSLNETITRCKLAANAINLIMDKAMISKIEKMSNDIMKE
ncbi:ribosomal protein S5 domain 2-like protein [Rozella allomycis CSF55]|uniref:Exoribonuclease, phosphorolytic 1 domain-containing protein n=1 Tax=Rozella allomycis (strain CSF55) TaxID=988480 RepID=A0A075ANH2_ROZAC|nr:Exoribonuclease, phosphorolytic 1 domain-containing protein [Rozella allomycis CSF55]RKP17297.1 ribosomal protein S5 domain 2-like protein [Rozella allomycis CSF55]|eukprot:EPZ31397.1 Exoribonuclease, phosphorolytic 1 domain-containing protein [Rozella allomycis CSF55]